MALKGSHRAVARNVVLGVLVVVAAGLGGTIHFTGARWVPHSLLNWTMRPPPAPPSHPPHTGSRVVATLPPTSHHAGGSSAAPDELWALAAIATIGAAWLLWRWLARRRAGSATPARPTVIGATVETRAEAGVEFDPPVLRTGVELALQTLDEQRDPTDAVVRAWLGLQDTAAASGIVRQPAETPTEFTSRIMRRAVADDRAVQTLLRLYLRARFGDHPVTSDDVVLVRGALLELVRTWPTPKSAAPPSRADTPVASLP